MHRTTKVADSRTEQEIFKMSLGYLIVRESEEEINKTKIPF